MKKSHNLLLLLALITVFSCRKEEETQPKTNENHFISFNIDGQNYKSVEAVTHFSNMSGETHIQASLDIYYCGLHGGYLVNNYTLESTKMRPNATLNVGNKTYDTYYKGHGNIKVDSAYGSVYSGTFSFVAYDKNKIDSVVVTDGVFKIDIRK